MKWVLMSAVKDDAALGSAAIAYVIAAIKDVKPDSNFDLASRPMRRQLPEDRWVPTLVTKGYDGLLLEHEGTFIGRLFFQKHADGSWHMFSIVVEEDFRGQGHAVNGIHRFLSDGLESGAAWFKLGDGLNPVMRGLYTAAECALSRELAVVFEDVGTGIVRRK